MGREAVRDGRTARGLRSPCGAFSFGGSTADPCCARSRLRPARRSAGPEARRAFYFWRTTFALSPAEQRALAALHVERIYLRVFDLGWADDAVAPLGPVGGAGPVPAGVEIVPVVYITAEAFKHLTPPQLQAVAGEAWRKVQDRTAALGFVVHELQLDCDWTDSTREGFFT